MAEIIRCAVSDALAYQKGGADAVIVENFGDVPFTGGRVASETVAAMALAGAEIAEALSGTELPLGFNVLRNDALSGLGLCAAVGGDFIRVNVHSGAMVTDQGLIEGDAYTTVRARDRIAPQVAILADVHVKHASPVGGVGQDIRVSAQDTYKRAHADGLIVSGSGTGAPTDQGELESVREACPDAPIFVGSGADAESAGTLLKQASGLIVGTAAKKGGKLDQPVDPERVAEIRSAFP